MALNDKSRRDAVPVASPPRPHPRLPPVQSPYGGGGRQDTEGSRVVQPLGADGGLQSVSRPPPFVSAIASESPMSGLRVWVKGPVGGPWNVGRAK